MLQDCAKKHVSISFMVRIFESVIKSGCFPPPPLTKQPYKY